MFDVFLDLLYPLEADAAGTDYQGHSRLNLGPLHPAVGTVVVTPDKKMGLNELFISTKLCTCMDL